MVGDSASDSLPNAYSSNEQTASLFMATWPGQGVRDGSRILRYYGNSNNNGNKVFMRIKGDIIIGYDMIYDDMI